MSSFNRQSWAHATTVAKYLKREFFVLQGVTEAFIRCRVVACRNFKTITTFAMKSRAQLL